MQNKYKISDRQRYDLITESSQHLQKCLGKLLTYIFSDQYIYIDQSFRNTLLANARGYVHVQDLQKVSIIGNYFKEMSVSDDSQKMYFIRGAIEYQCPELYYNFAKVRRKVPFNSKKFLKMKPICIERIRQAVLSIEDVRDYFEQHVYSLNQRIERNIDEDILVYSENYRNNLEKIRAKRPPFSIMNYEEYYKEYDITQTLKVKKLKQITRPIEMPRKRMAQQFERHNYRDNMKEDYQHNRKERRSKDRHRMKIDEEEFTTIGRQPNPDFNTLLTQICHPQTIDFQ